MPRSSSGTRSVPYDNLPDGIKGIVRRSTTTRRTAAGQYSGVRVRRRLRSGTLQYLHVWNTADLRKVSGQGTGGALGRAEHGRKRQIVFIESTAEGRTVTSSISARRRAPSEHGDGLTSMDFKFHFSPWWEDEAYAGAGSVEIPHPIANIFGRLKGSGSTEAGAESLVRQEASSSKAT